MSISKTIIGAGDTSHLVKKYDEIAIEYTGNKSVLCDDNGTDKRQVGSSIQVSQTGRESCKSGTS